MENRINQIMTLASGKKYMILHQAIYNNDNYYVCTGVEDNGKDLDKSFKLFHEMKNDNQIQVEAVQDPTLAEFILKHLSLMD